MEANVISEKLIFIFQISCSTNISLVSVRENLHSCKNNIFNINSIIFTVTTQYIKLFKKFVDKNIYMYKI